MLEMRPILAAVDHSRHAHAVVSRGAELASLLRGELTILTAIGNDPTRITTIAEEREGFTKFHRELVYKHFPSNRITVESKGPEAIYRYNPTGVRILSKILTGNPVDVICNYADGIKADIVVLGNRGLGSLGTLVLGSVSERVVRKCSRSVLVVKGEVSDSSDWETIAGSQSNEQAIGTE